MKIVQLTEIRRSGYAGLMEMTYNLGNAGFLPRMQTKHTHRSNPLGLNASFDKLRRQYIIILAPTLQMALYCIGEAPVVIILNKRRN